MMKSKAKQITLALLAGTAAVCVGGAMAVAERTTVRAAENYVAFVNVGGNADAALMDKTIGLTETENVSVQEQGTVVAGSSLFTSYSENAAYSFSLESGSYQVAVAVIAEEGTQISLNGEAVELPEGVSGETVVSASADGAFELSVTGKLCGVLVTEEESEPTLFTVTYTAGQIVPYGALLADHLENATGYYSDGSSRELPIEYGDIMAATGVNVNFTTVDVTGKIEGTELEVTRYLTTMPEDLVYFINSGSYTVDGHYKDTADDHYSYNQTVFDYYGESLLNSGTPDRKAPDENSWGYYGNDEAMIDYLAPGDATFPYNSVIYMEQNSAAELGYYLTGLTPGGSYRVYIGGISHWHARTVNIRFNGEIVGQDTLRVSSGKGLTVFENVTADENGKIDVYMKGASTNEPTIAFIAVQKSETEVAQKPADLSGPVTVGMEDHTYAFQGATAGATVRFYNAAKPFQILFEETVDGEKIAADGSYTVDFGEPFAGISQFCAVQITSGGAGEPWLISVTDIENFKATFSPEGYTTGAVTVTIEAQAGSGVASWSYRFGEYGELHEFALERPFSIHESFTATENGDYIVVVTSGLGVTYSETVTVTSVDANAPVLTVAPSKEGWSAGAYHVSLTVGSVAPVAQYRLYKEGRQIEAKDEAPQTVVFTEEGNYTIFVKTAAGQSSVCELSVREAPTVTRVTKKYANRTLTYTFGDTADFIVSDLTVYEVKESGVTRMTIASGNSMDVYEEGVYVATIATDSGIVEMFALNVAKEDFSATPAKEQGCQGLAFGGAGAGVMLAAVAGTVLAVLKKKKKD